MKKNKPHQFTFLIISAYVLMQLVGTARAQISTPCTTSMISTFTPCMSYVTGSSYNGTLPTTECCSSLKTIIRASIDCACLIVTANVPLPTNSIVSQALAISLPSFCNSPGISIQCQATGSPLPSQGLLLLAPPPTSAPTAIGTAAGPHSAPETSSLAPAASPVGVTASSKRMGNKEIWTFTTRPTSSSPSSRGVSYAAVMLASLWMMMLTACFE